MPPPSKEGILIIGEMIRLKMHRDPLIVKDRRYHFRNYPCCFIGKDVVEWLLKNNEAQSASHAIACMKVLQSNGIFHHVCDDHIFKNEYLFYRFRNDDGTFFVDTEYESYHEAIMVHQRILGDSNSCVMKNVHIDDETTLENCFVAHQLVSWLVANNIANDRTNAIETGKQFLKILIIKPVLKNECEFYDDDTMYRFIFDISSPLSLHKALNLNDDESHYAKGIEDYMKRISLDANSGRKCLEMFWKGDDNSLIEEPPMKIQSDINANEHDEVPKLKPVILRDVTVQELLSKESPYHWKNVRITSDAVGFGFVIRGDGPCYVQAIDPTGPAAVAGLKVRMYIYSVNGKIVLALNHNEVAKLIMLGVVVDLVVLQHFRSST